MSPLFEEGIEHCIVHVAVCNESAVLLVQDPVSSAYVFPSARANREETLSLVLQRALLSVGQVLQDVKRYLMHNDDEDKKERSLFYAVTVSEPENVILSQHLAYAWVPIDETFGYPILEQTREVLDLLRL